MKACPYHNEASHWHFCRNMSTAFGSDHFSFTGCKHAQDFVQNKFTAIAAKDRAAFEAKWDAHAEGLFKRYTALWTDAQRESFRARLWPVPPPVIPSELKLT